MKGKIKRMRVFAGPNGSGKTTIMATVKSKVNIGVYINANDIEKSLKTNNVLPFNDYSIKVNIDTIKDFFRYSRFSPIKTNTPDLWQKITIQNNCLTISTPINSYIAADIAEFLRLQMLENGISFTYETVMSHKSKIDFMQRAQEFGYRVYLYYVATEDPEINTNRVELRVAQQGHPVSKEIIEARYYKSLENLKSAVLATHRAYIFDNSGKASKLIAEITNSKEVNIVDDKVPDWFIKYLYLH